MAEIFAVLGLITSAITLIETSKSVFDAAKDAKGLHEAFRKVSENIPLVLEILKDARKVQKHAGTTYEESNDPASKKALEESAKATKPMFKTCEEDAQQLRDIFEKVVPGDDATWADRYWKAAQSVMPGKKRKVEDLMKEILQKLELLHTNHFFKDAARCQKLKAAVEVLSKIPPSLTEEDSRYHHSGSGSLNVNAGDGTQRNYTQSGGSGRQYNGDTQHIHEAADYESSLTAGMTFAIESAYDDESGDN